MDSFIVDNSIPALQNPKFIENILFWITIQAYQQLTETLPTYKCVTKDLIFDL